MNEPPLEYRKARLGWAYQQDPALIVGLVAAATHTIGLALFWLGYIYSRDPNKGMSLILPMGLDFPASIPAFRYLKAQTGYGDAGLPTAMLLLFILGGLWHFLWTFVLIKLVRKFILKW